MIRFAPKNLKWSALTVGGIVVASVCSGIVRSEVGFWIKVTWIFGRKKFILPPSSLAFMNLIFKVNYSCRHWWPPKNLHKKSNDRKKFKKLLWSSFLFVVTGRLSIASQWLIITQKTWLTCPHILEVWCNVHSSLKKGLRLSWRLQN